MTIKDHLALIFNQTVHFEGRKQVPLSTLAVGGLEPSEISMAVQLGWLKQGVQGYWLPEPTDPGFLSVVNSMSGEDSHPCIDHDSASAGRLTDRFGKD